MKPETIEKHLKQIDVLEAIGRIAENEDFKIFLKELRAAQTSLQSIYNDADLTKPIVAAEIKGQLGAVILILKQLDTTDAVVRQLRHELEQDRAKVVTGRGGRNPISVAVLPETGDR